MTSKRNVIQIALEEVSEAAYLLAIHGSKRYSLETSTLDRVFLRTLQHLKDALHDEDNNPDYFDPDFSLRSL